MRTVTAIEVRKRFGQIVDEAAAGERIVIERAGHPIAAIVPLSDLALVDPGEQRNRRLAALDEIRRRAHLFPMPPADTVAEIRRMREQRTQQIHRASQEASER